MACILGKKHVCCTRIEHLGVVAGREEILRDVNLHLHCGELTAIVGRNGAGKSTFMKALLDVIPHTGTITFESARKSKFFSAVKPRFGYVPQSLAVDEASPVSVEDLVLSCVSKKPVWLPHSKADRQKAYEILRMTNAQSLANRRVCDLSGGEIQRVMLSLAITPVPDILLLDEPVSGVDRTGLKNFYDLVSSLRRDYDITILLITHDLDLVAKHADRIVFINKNSAVSGTVAEIYGSKEFIKVFGKIELQDGSDSTEAQEDSDSTDEIQESEKGDL